MICLINVDKLKLFRKRKELRTTEVNLLSSEGADHAIFLVTEMFKQRGGKYHLRFWIDGSFHNKGTLIRECLVSHNRVVYLDE